MSTMKWAMVAALFATLTSAAHAQTLTREGTSHRRGDHHGDRQRHPDADPAERQRGRGQSRGRSRRHPVQPAQGRRQIRLTYHESLVLQLRKPGAASNSTGDTVAAGRTQTRAGRSGRDAADTDRHREGRGPEGAVHHRHDTGRAHGDEEGRGQEEHRKRRRRRSHRHHLHAGGGRQRRAGEVAAIPSARRPGPRGSRHCRSQAPGRPCRLP